MIWFSSVGGKRCSIFLKMRSFIFKHLKGITINIAAIISMGSCSSCDGPRNVQEERIFAGDIFYRTNYPNHAVDLIKDFTKIISAIFDITYINALILS